MIINYGVRSNIVGYTNILNSINFSNSDNFWEDKDEIKTEK